MGYLRIKQNSTNVIPRKLLICKARPITEVLSSTSWSGKRCFILCGGPSLENFDFNKLQNEMTIGVNKAFTKFPCTINYAMDQRFYDSIMYTNRADQESYEVHNAWLKYRGIKVFAKTSETVRFDPSVYVVNTVKQRCVSEVLSAGVYPGNNSGLGSLMLAIALGCKQIYMLGLDMKVDEKKGKTHFHSGYKNQKIEHVATVLQSFKKDFELFAPVFPKVGIEVINLNPDSELNCFLKKDAREVL
jgi:hypothetical protein